MILARRPPLAAVPEVDLQRFAGDWYLVAQIPTRLDRNAFDASASCRVDANGGLDATVRFRKGGWNEPLREIRLKARARDASNAVWSVQLVWPFQSECRIVDLAPDYGRAIVGRSKRDHAWILARTPALPEPDVQRCVRLLRDLDYDVGLLVRIPQRAATVVQRFARSE